MNKLRLAFISAIGLHLIGGFSATRKIIGLLKNKEANQSRKSSLLYPSIHPSIVLFQATRLIQKISTENNDRQKHRKHQRIKEKNTKHTVEQSRQNAQLHSTNQGITIHVFHLATSDFLALFISVSKLGRPVKSSILVTL